MIFVFSVVDYDVMRKSMATVFDGKIQEVRSLVSKLQKTQRAAEQTLEKYDLNSRTSLGWSALIDIAFAGMKKPVRFEWCGNGVLHTWPKMPSKQSESTHDVMIKLQIAQLKQY